MCQPLREAIGRHFEVHTLDLAQWMQSQLGRCRILDEALYEQSRQLVAEFVELEERYTRDQRELRDMGIVPTDSELISTQIVSADKHHGQHVLKLVFGDQQSIYYKPRFGSGAQLLGAVSKLCSQGGLNLASAKVMVREGYHWMSEVIHQASFSSSAAKQFAFDGGVLYAVAFALNSSDLHFENIIASVNGPVVVDCETLCQPRFSQSAAAYLIKRPREEYDDATSLFLNLDQYNGLDIDYGGLSCVDLYFQADPYAGLQVELAAEQRELVLHHSRSAIEVDGRRIAPAIEYFEEFIKGVRHAAEFIVAHRDELLELIEPRLTFRVTLRATRLYAALLAERMATICFSSYSTGGWRSFVESGISTCSSEFEPLARMIYEQESIDLDALDIPAAYVRADSRDLLLRDINVPGVFDLSPREVARDRLDKMAREGVDEQIAILRARIAKGSHAPSL
jgi:lantibiotic modifying enzyme